jgi:enoyl-CoA hydratase/carnithine racemase
MYRALANYCDTVENDASIRALVLNGAGGQAFSAGTDISEFKTFKSKEDGIAYEKLLDSVINRIETLSKPTIAKIEGVATGGGLAIIAACDLRICTPDSRFGAPISRTLGNCLSLSNHALLLDIIGSTCLKELLYTGRLLNADEALAGGLVTSVASAERINSVVNGLAVTIANNAPLTIKATKEMIRRIQIHRRPDRNQGDDLVAMCYSSNDFKAAVNSFLAKKPPSWKGS